MTEYIDRQAVLDELDEDIAEFVECDYALKTAKKYIKKIPPADVRPVVRGRWELAEDGWYCTACKLYPPFDCDPEEKGVPFCPNCGADMMEESPMIPGMCCDCKEQGPCCDYSENEYCPKRKEDGSCWVSFARGDDG